MDLNKIKWQYIYTKNHVLYTNAGHINKSVKSLLTRHHVRKPKSVEELITSWRAFIIQEQLLKASDIILNEATSIMLKEMVDAIGLHFLKDNKIFVQTLVKKINDDKDYIKKLPAKSS